MNSSDDRMKSAKKKFKKEKDEDDKMMESKKHSFVEKIKASTQDTLSKENNDQLFFKMLSREMEKINAPEIKRRLKRYLLNKVYKAQDGAEATDNNIHFQMFTL